MRPKLQHIIGLIAVVTGAIATFDNTWMPIARYLVIYLSILVITAVVLHEIYLNVDNTASLDKIKDEQ